MPSTKHCRYCGDELIFAHKDFGICGWCLKEIEENQAAAKKEASHVGYFSGDRDEYKGDIDYG